MIIRLVTIFMLAIFFVACKKDYQCECVTTLGSISSKTVSEAGFRNKKAAEDECLKKNNLEDVPKVECYLLNN